MDIENHLKSEHLYLTERQCRSRKKIKDLINELYKIRKNKNN